MTNVGRTEQLFTESHRLGLAARDGGYRWPGCDKPAAWTECHHLQDWARDNGQTDIAEGILLCRRHHLPLYNSHWQILRDGAEYWLKLPESSTRNSALSRCRAKAL